MGHTKVIELLFFNQIFILSFSFISYNIFSSYNCYDSINFFFHFQHTCEQCGDVFNRKGHLTEHVNHIHSQCDVYFECPECERIYEYEKNCLKHVRKDHKKILVPIR